MSPGRFAVAAHQAPLTGPADRHPCGMPVPTADAGWRCWANRLTLRLLRSYRRVVPIYEARDGERVWRFEPAATGMRLWLTDGRLGVPVAVARDEKELAELLDTLGLDVTDLREV